VNKSDIVKNWTRDKDGRRVNWTEPPYLVRGVLSLVLEGEDPRELDEDVFKQRLAEYHMIREKQRMMRMKAAMESGPYRPRPGGGIMRVDQPDN